MDISLLQLRKKETDLRKELEDVAGAIRVIERISGDSESTASQVESAASILGESGRINLGDLNVRNRSKVGKPTLISTAKKTIDRFESQEFTVNELSAALVQTGKGKDNKNFTNRVSSAVRQLTSDGFINRTHKGKGHDPHRYKRTAGKVSLVSSNSN